MRNWYFTAIAILALSCSKSEDDSQPLTPVSEVPSIEVTEVTPDSIAQFGNILFRLKYTDGNGDLGTEDADDHSLEILDTRDSILHTFHVPPLSPVPDVSITGTLEIQLDNVILLDQTNPSEEIVFEVRIRDREDNWSAPASSPVITVAK